MQCRNWEENFWGVLLHNPAFDYYLFSFYLFFQFHLQRVRGGTFAVAQVVFARRQPLSVMGPHKRALGDNGRQSQSYSF